MDSTKLRNILKREPDLDIAICMHSPGEVMPRNAVSYFARAEYVLDHQFEGEPVRRYSDEETFYNDLRDEIKEKVGDVPNLDELAEKEFERHDPYWKWVIVIQAYEER